MVGGQGGRDYGKNKEPPQKKIWLKVLFIAKIIVNLRS